jgi:hypothetical protein
MRKGRSLRKAGRSLRKAGRSLRKAGRVRNAGSGHGFGSVS